MIGREKVIKGLQCIIEGTVRCESCGYSIDKHGHYSCQQNCASDAITLLEEQEAVEPFYEEGEDFLNYFMKHTMGRCGHCKAPLPALEGMRSKFCWMCGRRVKWE